MRVSRHGETPTRGLQGLQGERGVGADLHLPGVDDHRLCDVAMLVVAVHHVTNLFPADVNWSEHRIASTNQHPEH